MTLGIHQQLFKPAFAGGKLGEWNWDQVIQIMGWEMTDQLIACGDYGSVYKYSPSESKIEMNDEEDDENASFDRNFQQKYICEIRKIVLDQPYDSNEYS